MSSSPAIIAARRAEVLADYNAAKLTNERRFQENDVKATSEYVYRNQKIDANAIVQEFNVHNRHVISITKKTKVGMDGLMIEVAKLMTTHPDDAFVVNPADVRIITGMSNVSWEKDMKDKSPNCFKDKIFHHGQLKKAGLNNIKNALIIIDEIDTGDKEFQVLHNTLKDAGVLNVAHMEKNNNRFVFASATMIKELYDLYQWGELHKWFQMTIPINYIGHSDFLAMGLIQEFYPLNTDVQANQWIDEDILANYGTDFRIHIARVNNKSISSLQNACIRKGIKFCNHTSADRLTEETIKELFTESLTGHVVLGIKGFFRRANLIPNEWKKRIGATHELHTKTVDNSVQVQGLPGRMSGYWREIVEGGHKTGPHRTSIKAVEDYEKVYNDPFGANSYQCAGFKKKDGVITAEPTMLAVKNIAGLIAPSDVLQDPAQARSASCPITILKLDGPDKFRKPNFRFIFKQLDSASHDKYEKYKLCFWRADTPTKCSKWGIYRMKESDARSSSTNITEKDKPCDILMVYQYNDELIVSPWNGTVAAA